MHGFSIYISNNDPVRKIGFTWKPLFGFQPEHVHRTYISEHLHIEQHTSNKFIQDKLWLDTPDYFIVTDGVITNLKKLCDTYKTNDYTGLITKIHTQEYFYNEFTGHFAGFLLNKKTNTYIAFNNHCGTKKLFYFHNDETVLFSTDLYTLSKALDDLQIPKYPDIEAAYLLLTSGFMHDNKTLINEVKQIGAGEFAKIEKGNLTTGSYFHLRDIVVNKDSKKEIIHKLDFLFKKSVQLEFDKDRFENLKSVTTLSGGLDSRMTALVAYESGYQDQLMLNFSEKGYADEVIANQISKKYHLDIQQIPLSADGLCSIDKIVRINDGLTLYSGSGHVFEALGKMIATDTGFVHTGMIGDAVLGSFLTGITEKNPHITDGLYSNGLFNKAENALKKSISAYENEELYKFYNRAFLGANNGFLYFDLIGETSSPFLEPEFISYAYSIPLEYKYKKKIYIDWIRTCHPDLIDFTWESMGGKPTNNALVREYYRYRRALIKRLPVKSMWKNNMNPEQLWYDKNTSVQQTLDAYFEENIAQVHSERELYNDLIQLYQTGNIIEKTQVLTLLAAYKLLF